jgi:hypothetical protein
MPCTLLYLTLTSTDDILRRADLQQMFILDCHNGLSALVAGLSGSSDLGYPDIWIACVGSASQHGSSH